MFRVLFFFLAGILVACYVPFREGTPFYTFNSNFGHFKFEFRDQYGCPIKDSLSIYIRVEKPFVSWQTTAKGEPVQGTVCCGQPFSATILNYSNLDVWIRGKRYAPILFYVESKSAWLHDTVFMYRFPHEYRPMNCRWDVFNEGVFASSFRGRSGFSDSLVDIFNKQLAQLIGQGISLHQTDSGMSLVGTRKRIMRIPRVGNIHEILDIPKVQNWSNEVELCPQQECELIKAPTLNQFNGYKNINALIIKDDSTKIISKMYLRIYLDMRKVGEVAYWAVCSQPDSTYGDYIQTSPSIHPNNYNGYFWEKSIVQNDFSTGRLTMNQKKYRPIPTVCRDSLP